MVHWVVLFGIPESDFHTNCRNIVTVQNMYNYMYWIVNGLSVEDGISLSQTHTHACTQNTFRVEKLYGLNTSHVFIDFHWI